MLLLLFGLAHASFNLNQWNPDFFTDLKWYEGSVEIKPINFNNMPHKELKLQWVDTHGLNGKDNPIMKTTQSTGSDEELFFNGKAFEKKMFNYKYEEILFNIIYKENTIGTASLPVKWLRQEHGFDTAYPNVGYSLKKEYTMPIKLKQRHKVLKTGVLPCFNCSSINIQNPQLKVYIDSIFYTIKTEVGIPILVPPELKVAAGWDTEEKSKKKPDLDPSLVLMEPGSTSGNTASKNDNFLYWSTKATALKKQWRISQDDQDGEGGGDDEVLFVDLDYIKKNKPFGTKILVSMWSYNGHDLSKAVKDGYIRLASISKSYSATARENFTIAYERVGTGEFSIFGRGKEVKAVTGYLFGVIHQGPLIPDYQLNKYHSKNKNFENWYFTALEKPIESAKSDKVSVKTQENLKEMFELVNNQQEQNWAELKDYYDETQAPDFSQFYAQIKQNEGLNHDDIITNFEEVNQVMVPDYIDNNPLIVPKPNLAAFIGYTDEVTNNMYNEAYQGMRPPNSKVQGFNQY